MRSGQEPTDRAVLLLKRAGELLPEYREVIGQLQHEPEGESPAAAAERHAYGLLVAALEQGLVTTLEHAMDVMQRHTGGLGPAGAERWLREQLRKLDG